MLALLILLGVLVFRAITEQVLSEDCELSKRLSNDAIPTHYNIQIRIENLSGKDSYEGLVEIYIEILNATNEIVLHSTNHSIRKIRLFHQNSDTNFTELDQPTKKLEDLYDLLILTSNQPLGSGNYLLHISFEGTVTDVPEGIFTRFYTDREGRRRSYTAVHCEPMNARKIFPCFDEPGFKASFNVSIIHHQNYSAATNMPLISALPYDQHYVKSSFQQTPRMSTYLLSFVVSDFIRETFGEQSILASVDVLNGTEFAKRIANDIMIALDTHFRLPYKKYMPQITHLIIPNLTSHWYASENWGLISYREDCILFDSTRQDLKQRTVILECIAHELAHQWFGNLVTPVWWDHLWIKEGLATLYGFYALHLAYPTEGFMDLVTAKVLQVGLRDSSDRKPIARSCASKEASEKPDVISVYHKSASVFNMFRVIMGDDRWRQFMINFLRNRALESITPEDLYAEIELVAGGENLFPAGMTVKEVFDSWISNAGTPVITVHRLYNNRKMIISQTRMQSCPENSSNWIIPYSYVCTNSTSHDDTVQWLTTLAELVNVDASEKEWIVLNKQQFGTYRVNYDEQNWRLIIEALRRNVSCIPRLNRVQLLDDAFNLFEDDKLDAAVLLELTTFLRHELDPLVWSTAQQILDYLYAEFVGTTYIGHLKAFFRYLVEPIYQRLSTKPDILTLNLSAKKWIVKISCSYGNEECHDRARMAFKRVVQTNTPVSRSDYTFVYCFGQQNSTDFEFDWLLRQLLSIKDHQDRHTLLTVTACTNRVDRLWRLIDTVQVESMDDEEQWRDSFDSIVTGIEFGLINGQFAVLVELLSSGTMLLNQLGVKLVKMLVSSVTHLAVTEIERNALVQSLGSMDRKHTNFTEDVVRSLFLKNDNDKKTTKFLSMVAFLESFISEL
ncbi:aminopeptidase N-like [Malaya genurostris]|uniref:aminopeptidase N-like n=1 Tax=Malaya genurostris TaxID=325434 RepID=UPI0026F407F2|nr:aminopeptidase N-like [Malaya genurostris]XP_058451117.1 aminopeptidase N-like [Malaya genurostris]